MFFFLDSAVIVVHAVTKSFTPIVHCGTSYAKVVFYGKQKHINSVKEHSKENIIRKFSHCHSSQCGTGNCTQAKNVRCAFCQYKSAHAHAPMHSTESWRCESGSKTILNACIHDCFLHIRIVDATTVFTVCFTRSR